jgi:ribosomal-protein-alanine N-acetyltransferase
MKIETKRLLIRSIIPTDAPFLAKLWTDPIVTKYMGGPRTYDDIYEEFTKDAQDTIKPKIDLWPVIEKSTGSIIGHCGILDKDIENEIEYELIYVIAKSYWGKGYATEAANNIKNFAFHQLGLKRIICLIDPQNKASQRVALKVGLQYKKEIIRPSGKKMYLFSLNR